MQGRNRDDSKLSQNPVTIRARIRRRTAKFNDDVDQLLKVQGYKPVTEWTFEELQRGKPKGPDGRWKTGVPSWITPRIADEVKKRFRDETKRGLTKYTATALRVLADLLQNDDVDHLGKPIVSAKDRIDVAKFIIEHTIGKPAAKVDVDVSASRWREVLSDSLALPDGSDDYTPGDVIDGEFEEDEHGDG